MNKIVRLFFLLGFCIQTPFVFSQVTADFISNVQSGCSPLPVNFTNLSTGPITSYFWDFGNGNTSTLQTPGVFYSVPGTYTVTLTVSDGANTDTRTRIAYITVFAEPAAAISADVTTGCTPLAVNFTDLTTPGDAPITAWLWDFGDGVTSNLQNPSHTYNTPGAYDVTLVVVDSNGCSTTLIEPNFIQVSATPNVDFSADFPQACNAPHTITFTSNVTPPSGTYTYFWDFGDGNTSTLPNPGHSYTATGNYTVSLTVTDPFGCSSTETKINFVQIGSPTAGFTVGSPRTCVGQVVSFTNTSTGGNSYFWDFGDGGTSTLTNPTHIYSAPGFYTVRLTVTNTNFGCSSTIIMNGAVDVRPTPAVNFTATNNIGCQAPLTVTFNDITAGAVTWAWDFGDGNTANSQNPIHVYTAPGTYNVSLTVTNSDGCSATRTIPALVQIIPPIANFSSSVNAGCTPLTVSFFDLSTSNDPIVTWIWNFGDGNSSFNQFPTHTYTVAGQYTVSLTVITASGCQSTLIQNNFIQVGDKPIANFVGSPTSVCVEDTVCFTNLTNFGNIWTWTFGDGNGSNAQDPCHVYQDTGTFTVMLIAEENGCRDTMVLVDYIHSVGPIADFTMAPGQGCRAPLSVSFFDQSIDPTDWYWDFGDGDTSILQNPTHIYTTPGTYTITLVATNTNTNCTDTHTETINISSPTASFTVPPTYGCSGTSVTFTNASLNATTYQWDFGDGGTSTAANPTYTYNTPGSFTVTLIASDGFGCADTFATTTSITIAGSVPDFVADTTYGCSPFTVNFTDLTTTFPNPPNGIAGWFWDFGDGNTSTAQNPIHTYNTPGSYTVTLQIVDTEGCVEQVSRSGYINPTFPDASFTTNDTLACPGSLVRFTNNSTGTGLTFLWDFGDGTTSSVVNPQHLYAPGGPYTITLTATDANGCQDIEIASSYVTVGQPTAGFTSTATSAACPPLQVDFFDQSSPDVVSWFWDFGDGSTSTLANPMKVYGIAGTYTVTLYVENGQGCRDTLEMVDLVQLSGPTGSFTMGPITGCNPLTVNFTATTAGAVSWAWDFGDGSLGTGQTVSHTYTRDTTARPTLIMRDTAGCPVTVQATDSIVVKPLPVPNFTVDFNDICLGQRVTFTNTTTSRDQVVLYNWDFGDGNTSSLQNPVHTYTAIGVYTVVMWAETNEGCRDTIAVPITINVKGPPTAVFTASNTRGCQPLSNVIFTDASFGPFVINSWDWDFGDGNTSTLQNPVHTFNTAGIFNVRLIATDIEGCSDTAFVPITVDALPNVDFTVSNRFGCAPHNVLFQDLTTGSAPGVSWFWDFGDGNTSTTQNPLHTYASDGVTQ